MPDKNSPEHDSNREASNKETSNQETSNQEASNQESTNIESSNQEPSNQQHTNQQPDGSNNPYQSPDSSLDVEPEGASLNMLAAPRAVSFGRCVGWIGDGFGYFKQSPGQWILILFLGLAIMIGLSMLPLIGQLIMGLTSYVWFAGLMLGCKALYQGREFSVNYLFAGFKEPLVKLILLSIITGVLNALSMYSVMGDFYLELLKSSADAQQQQSLIMEDPGRFWQLFFFGMLAMIPVMMASIFAPALIAIHDISILKAMQFSFLGCVKNILPLFVFAVIMLLLYIVSVIPIFLGLLVFMPTAFAAIFSAYKDIFTEPHAANDRLEL